MPPSDGHDSGSNSAARVGRDGGHSNVETMLFDALVHQLIEKGLMTKNDAMSVVQTVAEVQRGQLNGSEEDARTNADLALLNRLYVSFEVMRDRSVPQSSNLGNVLQLRPPLHGNAPQFPHEE